MNDNLLGQAFPAHKPTAELPDAVATRVASSGRRDAWRKANAYIAAAALTAVALVIFAPRAASASAIEKMQTALEKARSYRMVTYLVREDGELARGSTVTWLEGKSKEDRGAEVIYNDGNAVYRYLPMEKTAVRLPRGSTRDPLTTVEPMLAELRKASWVKGIVVDEDSEFRGKPAIMVSFESTSEPSRMRMYADKTTSLPVRGELDWRTPAGDWRLERVIDIEYGVAVDAATVAPDFARDVRVLDNDQLKEEWRGRLSKGIATIKTGQSPIVIRDAVVLLSGDVMVLYTNGSKHVPYKAGTEAHISGHFSNPRLDSMTDERSRTYVAVDGVQGTMYDHKDRLVGGYVFGGEDLQAAWFTPIAADDSADRAKLKFGGYTHTLKLRKGGVVPEWSDFLGMSPRHGTKLEADASGARGNYYLNSDPARAEQEILKCIRLNDQWVSEIGERILQASSYQTLGTALKMQGKFRDARKAYERAIEHSPAERSNIEAMMKSMPD